MDPRVREVIQNSMNNAASSLQSLEEISGQKMESVIETCFSRNESNPDRFAECLLDKQQKL